MRNPLTNTFSIPFFLGATAMAAAFVFLFVLTEPIRQAKPQATAKAACNNHPQGPSK